MPSDLETARRRAQRQLERLQTQFNSTLPAQMHEVQRDLERLDAAIAASRAQVDASDLIAKYSS